MKRNKYLLDNNSYPLQWTNALLENPHLGYSHLSFLVSCQSFLNQPVLFTLISPVLGLNQECGSRANNLEVSTNVDNFGVYKIDYKTIVKTGTDPHPRFNSTLMLCSEDNRPSRTKHPDFTIFWCKDFFLKRVASALQRNLKKTIYVLKSLRF